MCSQGPLVPGGQRYDEDKETVQRQSRGIIAFDEDMMSRGWHAWWREWPHYGRRALPSDFFFDSWKGCKTCMIRVLCRWGDEQLGFEFGWVAETVNYQLILLLYSTHGGWVMCKSFK